MESHSTQVRGKNQPLLSVYAGYYRGTRTAWRYKKDCAFAKIENPVCDGKVLTFVDLSRSDVVKASRSIGPFLIRYHGDESYKEPSLSPQCYLYTRQKFGFLHPNHRRLLRSTEKLYADECDMHTGSSGSPIFIDLGSGTHVFAINAWTIVYERYRLNHRTRCRHITYSHTFNIAVSATAFIEGLEHSTSETLISGLADLREIEARL